LISTLTPAFSLRSFSTFAFPRRYCSVVCTCPSEPFGCSSGSYGPCRLRHLLSATVAPPSIGGYPSISRRLWRKSFLFDLLLRFCLLSTGSAGPYPFSRHEPGKIVSALSFYFLLKIPKKVQSLSFSICVPRAPAFFPGPCSWLIVQFHPLTPRYRIFRFPVHPHSSFFLIRSTVSSFPLYIFFPCPL